MTNDSHDERSPDERALLDALPREAAPLPALEERVVRELVGRGLLRRRHTIAKVLRFAAPFGAPAAAVLVFVAGVATGRRETPVEVAAIRPAAPADDPRPQFVLFLQEGGEDLKHGGRVSLRPIEKV